jgi:hypothetical protein
VTIVLLTSGKNPKMPQTSQRRLATCIDVVASPERTSPRMTWIGSSAAAVWTNLVKSPKSAALVEARWTRSGRDVGQEGKTMCRTTRSRTRTHAAREKTL